MLSDFKFYQSVTDMCYIESFIPARGGSASYTDSSSVVATTKISVVVPDSASLCKVFSSSDSFFASSVVFFVIYASIARVVVKGVVTVIPW